MKRYVHETRLEADFGVKQFLDFAKVAELLAG